MTPDDGLVVAGEIGSGAIATVVRIDDRVRGRSYAGKILHDRHQRDAGAHQRFQREAELASRLAHENLVRVWGTRQIDGRTVLLMELVEGPNLADHLACTGPMGQPDVVRMARAIASGLSCAHSAGVIHRDLKPANILLAGGPATQAMVPKIADFGMARASSFASADKGALTVLGTPQYMAPECLEPLAVDPRTDLYALGCIMVELATGVPPYGGATPMAVLQAHKEAEIPELPVGFSEPLRRLVKRLLAKAPGDRPQSASAVVDALDRLHSTALATLDPHAFQVQRAESTAEGHCAQCGEKVMRELRVCFACGLAQVVIEPGDGAVFVTGPGRSPHKFDSGLRDRLVRWLRANAVAGVDATRLEATIPRLPFTLITGVSQDSARSFVTSLSCLGITSDWAIGGRLGYEGIKRKARILTQRSAVLSIAIFGAPVMVSPAFGLVSVPLILVSLPLIYGVMLAKSSTPYAEMAHAPVSTLPTEIRKQLAGLHVVVGQIVERRHRDALRAVVNRVIALCRGIAPTDHGSIELQAEMSHAIALAAAATTRMDWLDRAMQDPAFDPADPQHRVSMHERDTWSARLLDLTATLDSLAARRATADARIADDDGDDLDALRAMVEALEEVQQR